MKIVNPLNSSYSGESFDIGHFHIIRIYKSNLTVIRVSCLITPEVFISDAPVIRSESDVWSILRKLNLTTKFAKAIIKKVKQESFRAGQEDIKEKFRNLIDI